MKTLILVRHAESGWAGASERDIDRTLTEAGRSDAAQMASMLKVRQILPDRFYTSNAKRAHETADIFLKGLVDSDRLLVKSSLYEPKVASFYRVIEETTDNIDSLIIFSHNPGISLFVNELDCHAEVDMPPCGMFAVNLETTEWKNLQIAEKRFLFYHVPRQW